MIHWLPMTDIKQLPIDRIIIVWWKTYDAPMLVHREIDDLFHFGQEQTIEPKEVSHWTTANKP